MKKIIISLAMGGMLAFAGCSGKDKAGENERNQFLLYSILGGSSTECAAAVGTMNKCVSTGYGFDPNIMCSPAQTAAYTAADYTTLKSCVEGVILLTNCQYSSNKAATAQIAADSSTGIFKDCNVPEGIIKATF